MKTGFFFYLILLCCIKCFGFSIFSMDKDPYTTSTGELVLKAGARYRGMGGAGLALADSINYNVQNPASFGAVDYTLLSLTYLPEITRLKENGNNASFQDFSDDFPAAELVISLGKYGTLFGGYKRDRLLNYDISYKDKTGYQVHRFGTGGTYITHGGYAYAYQKRFSLGASLGGLYGKTKTGSFIQGRPSSGHYLEPSRYQKETFKGYVLDFGGILKADLFSLGLAATAPMGQSEVDREHQIIQYYKLTSFVDSIVTEHSDVFDTDLIPPGGTIGLAYTPFSRLNLALDLHTVLWNTKDRDNEFYIATGGEIFFSKRRSENYFKNIPLRMGYYYHNLGYRDPIKEQALTLGFTLPTLNHYGFINVGLEGGKRYCGSLTGSTLTETFYRCSIQLVHKGRWGRLRRATRSKTP
jgi:hypothetical protein